MLLQKVPSGQTAESFINCKIENIKRLIDLYEIIYDDSDGFDTDTCIKIDKIGYKLQELLTEFITFKGEIQ